MSDNNVITVRGRVGTDPELTVTPNDRSVAHFRLGSTRRFRDSTGEWRDADTEWFTVKAWGPMAESVITSISRGMPVIVEGTYSTEEWQSGEQTRHRTVITAQAVGVDIRYGLVRYVKVARDPQTGAGVLGGSAVAGTRTVENGAAGNGTGSAGTVAGMGVAGASGADADVVPGSVPDEPDPWLSAQPSS